MLVYFCAGFVFNLTLCTNNLTQLVGGLGFSGSSGWLKESALIGYIKLHKVEASLDLIWRLFIGFFNSECEEKKEIIWLCSSSSTLTNCIPHLLSSVIFRHYSIFLYFICNKRTWLAHHSKKEKKRNYYWPRYIYVKGGQHLPKAYGDKSEVLWRKGWGTNWELGEHNGNPMGTHWELKGKHARKGFGGESSHECSGDTWVRSVRSSWLVIENWQQQRSLINTLNNYGVAKAWQMACF